MNTDETIRAAAFVRVADLTRRFGGAIPWEAICAPLDINGEDVRIANRARGIFSPRQMARGVLSIKTTIPRTGRSARYDDIASDEGFFVYRFQGSDPESSDNIALRESFEDQAPLIYFHGVAPGLYQSIYPVYLTEWNSHGLSVHAVPGEMVRGIRPAQIQGEDLRRYAAIEAKKRLHQAVFRELVINAYNGRCALTGLPEKRLLHAAHILPDKDSRGQPVVNNGIAMSVLHHTAYDQNLLGIDPDLRIHINRSLLEIHDGPTLRYALQQLDGAKLREPSNRCDLPSQDYLAERYALFLEAA
jgi:putative restriction endonuclease